MGGKGFLVAEEQGGERFPNLEAAQRLALIGLSAGLAKVLHELVAEGSLVQEGDHLVVRSEEAER